MLESMRKLMAAAAARPTSGSARAPAAATRRRAVAFLSPAHLPPRGGAGPARGAGRGGGEKPRPGAGPAAAGGGGGGRAAPSAPFPLPRGTGSRPSGRTAGGPGGWDLPPLRWQPAERAALGETRPLFPSPLESLTAEGGRGKGTRCRPGKAVAGWRCKRRSAILPPL